MGESNIDEKAYAQWAEMLKRIGTHWTGDVHETNSAHNSKPLQEMTRLEGRASSLILIKDKTPELRKKFKEIANEYERLANCCIAFARRRQQV